MKYSYKLHGKPEFFGVMELYKKCIETQNRMTYEESSAISGEIYSKMLEQCRQAAKE